MGAPPRPFAGSRDGAVVGVTSRTTAPVAQHARAFPLDAARFQQTGSYLHAAGSRAIAEFLAELDRRLGCGAEVLDQAAAWRRQMPPELLALVLEHYAGGRPFPPHLSEVPS